MKRMKRDAALKVIARHAGDSLVVAAYQAAFEWIVIRPSDCNLIATGAMGQASSHGLGLAIGRPDRKVLVLDGDGSLLMNLGSLVTIAEVAPANLFHFVCNNGVYEANGAHPTPGSDTVDFPGLALAAGYGSAEAFDNLPDLESRIGDVLGGQGPVLVDLRVEQAKPIPRTTPTCTAPSTGPPSRPPFAPPGPARPPPTARTVRVSRRAGGPRPGDDGQEGMRRATTSPASCRTYPSGITSNGDQRRKVL